MKLFELLEHLVFRRDKRRRSVLHVESKQCWSGWYPDPDQYIYIKIFNIIY